MTQELKSTATGNSPAPKSRTEQTASSAMTREQRMKKLSDNPRFKIMKPSGKGFVIGGAKPIK
jgi:hypothetical protein